MLIIGNSIILLEPSSGPHVQGRIIKISSKNNEEKINKNKNNEDNAYIQSQMCLQ